MKPLCGEEVEMPEETKGLKPLITSLKVMGLVLGPIFVLAYVLTLFK